MTEAYQTHDDGYIHRTWSDWTCREPSCRPVVKGEPGRMWLEITPRGNA